MGKRVPVVTSSAVADSDMIGMGADGERICTIHLSPSLVFLSIDGDKEYHGKVATWHISPHHAERVAAVAAWQSMGYTVGGTA